MKLLNRLLDWLAGKPTGQRSPQWPDVRAEHLARNPKCEVCGSANPEVHHRMPVSHDPTRELDPANLISLCREHHLLFGHGGDWKARNDSVVSDAARAREMIRNRKYP